MRGALGIGGLFMLIDALVSMDASTDKRAAVQAGRALRALVGLSLGFAALSMRRR